MDAVEELTRNDLHAKGIRVDTLAEDTAKEVEEDGKLGLFKVSSVRAIYVIVRYTAY